MEIITHQNWFCNNTNEMLIRNLKTVLSTKKILERFSNKFLDPLLYPIWSELMIDGLVGWEKSQIETIRGNWMDGMKKKNGTLIISSATNTKTFIVAGCSKHHSNFKLWWLMELIVMVQFSSLDSAGFYEILNKKESINSLHLCLYNSIVFYKV